jgi:hypothetical protein
MAMFVSCVLVKMYLSYLFTDDSKTRQQLLVVEFRKTLLLRYNVICVSIVFTWPVSSSHSLPHHHIFHDLHR